MAISGGYAPTCSVIVCTRNRPTQLHQCLTALADLDYPAYEVVVVDNAPTDQSSREIALRARVRYLHEPHCGLSRARNHGARACATEIIAYIDDDALAAPDWLSVLTRGFAEPRTMAVTGAILPSHPTDGATASAEATVASIGQARIVDRETPRWFEIANFGGLGDGSNMAFRRSVFDVWPGFAENLGRGAILKGGEEHYAFFTLIERGYRVVYDPKAIVRHPHPGTTAELRERHLELLATASAYITRLAVEHPSHRRALARYLMDSLRGTPRPWMNRWEKGAGPRIAPRWLELLKVLSGPSIYLRSRMSGAVQTGHVEIPAKNLQPDSIRRRA